MKKTCIKTAMPARDLIDAVTPSNDEVQNEIFSVSKQIDIRTSYNEKLFMLYFLTTTFVFVLISCIGEISIRDTLLNDEEIAKDRSSVSFLNDNMYIFSIILSVFAFVALCISSTAIYFASGLYRYNELQNEYEFQDIEDISPHTYSMEGSNIASQSMRRMENIERNLRDHERRKEYSEMRELRRRRIKKAPKL